MFEQRHGKQIIHTSPNFAYVYMNVLTYLCHKIDTGLFICGSATYLHWNQVKLNILHHRLSVRGSRLDTTF